MDSNDKTKGTPIAGGLPPFLTPKVEHVVVLSLKGETEKVFKIHKERIVIGRVESSDVRLTGEDVAPLHAVLEVLKKDEGTRITIYDLGSETGISLNGQKVITEQLKNGDELNIGSHTLIFSLEAVSQISPRDKIKESEGRKLFLNPKEDLKPLLLEAEHEIENIFDYTVCSKLALQVVMSWHGCILDVEHFVDRHTVTLGGIKGSDFIVPPVFSTPKFSLVTKVNGDYTLFLDPRMTGVIQRNGKLQKIEEIDFRGAQVLPLPFGKDDFAKIRLLGIDFYLNFTPAPPRLKRRKMVERDPFLLKVMFSSLFMTAFFIFALLNAHVSQNIEAEKIPDRVATILYQPEKFQVKIQPKPESLVSKEKDSSTVKQVTPKKKPTPKETIKVDMTKKANPPKEVPKEMLVGIKPQKTSSRASLGGGKRKENEAKEGEGARAKGKEGKRGSPKAPPGKIPQTIAKRPSPQAGEGRGTGHSQVPDEGNIDVLKGASSKILNLLGNAGVHLGKDGSQLQGFGGFTTQG
ncbi:MAG: FHA domain-containing protein [Deltaproteobacteria bacterium]|nr:FHA domain-containing protein [Deltaproteobacteria bacterium]